MAGTSGSRGCGLPARDRFGNVQAFEGHWVVVISTSNSLVVLDQEPTFPVRQMGEAHPKSYPTRYEVSSEHANAFIRRIKGGGALVTD